MALSEHYELRYLDPDAALSDFPSQWDHVIDKIDTGIHDAATDNVELSRIPNLPAGKTTSGRFADARIPTTVARTSETSALESRIAELESGPRSTGPRDLTDELSNVNITGGSVTIIRIGNVIDLSFENVEMTDTGAFIKIFSLPNGFQPVVTHRWNMPGLDNKQQFTVFAGSGSVYAMLHDDYTYRLNFVYLTDDEWPTSLPGKPA